MFRTNRTSSIVQRIAIYGVWMFSVFVCSMFVIVAGMYLYLDPRNPDVETYRNFQHETPLRIFSAEGALLAEFGDRRLIPISIEDVPQMYIDAVVSTEDKRFFQHQGIDWISLANDSFDLLFSRGVKRGASTITMQLPRNVADLSREQTLVRKFREMLLALNIERELSKKEILELYMNVVPFGKHAYGVQAAAYTYYGAGINDLNLAQVAMLAGIPKRPEAGNPINGPEWALERRDLVLRRMRDNDVITAEQYESAAEQPITARIHHRELDLYSPYPAEFVRQELVNRFGGQIYTGYSVYTTIDVDHQEAAQNALQSELRNYDKRYGYRGPERRISLNEDEEPLAKYLEELADESVVAGFEPAVVLEVHERSIDVVAKDGSTLQIPWDDMRWARRSLGEGRVSRSPQTASEIAQVGDLVRVFEVDEGWELSQIPKVQGALISIHPRTGSITSMVGGYSFDITQYNHATQSRRQPGSGFKPFVYTAALANGVTPATVFLDAPLVFDDEKEQTSYRPRNFSGDYQGPTRVREALYRSINLVSLRVLAHVGSPFVREFLTKFGFEKDHLPDSNQLAIGGGSLSVSPLQMASAYAVIANGGYRINSHVIDRVVNHAGEVVYQPIRSTVCDSCGYFNTGWDEDDWTESSEYFVEHPATDDAFLDSALALDERLAYLVDSMLRDVVKRGTGRRALTLGRTDLAGKTGTTDEAVDTWYNGYQQNLVATTWVGMDDQESLGETEYGSTRPLTIWIDFMRNVLEDVPEYIPEPPDGIVRVKIDPETGRTALPGQSDAIDEYFLQESSPVAQTTRDLTQRGIVDPEDIF